MSLNSKKICFSLVLAAAAGMVQAVNSSCLLADAGFVAVQDNTVSAGNYTSNRPKEKQRLFRSTAVEKEIVYIKTVKKEEEQKAEEKQLEILEAYIKNLEQLNEKTSTFRHDYKNILSGLSGFLKEGKIEELTAYLSEIIHATEKINEGQDSAWKELRYVYPLELKGFLYEKILSASAQKIQMQVQVDEKLDFKCSYMNDVIRILGIFIDNAIEETRDMENGYIIIVAMNTEQGCLFSVTNNYKTKLELALMQQRGYTTKGENRGMGLYWAEEMIKMHEIIHNMDITGTEIVQEIEIIKE